MPRGTSSRGRLATDRPRVAKLFGSYNFNLATELGGFFYVGSGTLLTINFQTFNQVGISPWDAASFSERPSITRRT